MSPKKRQSVKRSKKPVDVSSIDINKAANKKTVSVKVNTKPSPEPVKQPKSSTLIRLFPFLAVIILLGTTIFWSILGAHIQSTNSDQLVDGYLFKNFNTFQNSQFPGAHSALLKWPLFLLVRLFGLTNNSFVVVTVITVLITVLLFAYILHKINPKPLIFGTICLALSSVLLLVPAEPYPGAVLPVNMAMINTRNLEYILYILILILIIKTKKLRSWALLLAIVLISLLGASDKLFLIVGLSGSLLALLVYALSNHWTVVSTSAKWLLTSACGFMGAAVVLWLVNVTKLTHILNQTNVSPYSAVTSLKQLITGVCFGILNLFTNFGANPASSTGILKDVPRAIFHGLLTVSGFSFIINALILIFGLVVLWRFILRSLKFKHYKTVNFSSLADKLTVMLVATSIAAFLVFILSSHSYSVDARYLTITLFTVFIAFATYSRGKKYSNHRVGIIAAILIVSIIFGIFGAIRNYNSDTQALSAYNIRNQTIVNSLSLHPVKALVGDYWRVLPIRQITKGSQNVDPLSSCEQQSDTFTSKLWQPDLRNTSFAYLATLDTSPTGFNNCSLNQIVSKYGHPSETDLISGTYKNPKEFLVYYFSGINEKSLEATDTHPITTVTPIDPSELPNTSCDGPTIMNIVAHEDDDILFMNPDTINSIRSGNCVRTVYVTAGDDGIGKVYWQTREKAAESAYSYMIGSNMNWIQRTVELSSHEYITVDNPKGNTKISLIFIRLPDGNLNGEGFKSNNFESIEKLISGKIYTAQTVDGQSYYTNTDLINAFVSIMHIYQPTEVRTQADYASKTYPDHDDHITVGEYVTKALPIYEKQQYQGYLTIPVKYYIGYPIRSLSVNVTGANAELKLNTFLAYAQYDRSVCKNSGGECTFSNSYTDYLARQYSLNSD